MAGLGSRFVKEGYKLPKQILNAGNKQLIDISLDCVDLETCNLIFVVRDAHVFGFDIEETTVEESIPPLRKAPRGTSEIF